MNLSDRYSSNYNVIRELRNELTRKLNQMDNEYLMNLSEEELKKIILNNFSSVAYAVGCYENIDVLATLAYDDSEVNVSSNYLDKLLPRLGEYLYEYFQYYYNDEFTIRCKDGHYIDLIVCEPSYDDDFEYHNEYSPLFKDFGIKLYDFIKENQNYFIEEIIRKTLETNQFVYLGFNTAGIQDIVDKIKNEREGD